ncbi:MAG: hypothetical protein NTY12_01730 [Candidatus Falkowbacteria bacterium]|nr:hypothetical protein [Candidatus Falkowbacteria bacterium]
MIRYYKFSELLAALQENGLLTIKNAFLKGSNLRKGAKPFEGNFLIVSDTKKSKKYFLSLNVTNDELEKSNNYANILGESNYAWAISLVNLITLKKTKLFVWCEGVVEYEDYSVKFTQGPGEINLAMPEQIIPVIKSNISKRESDQPARYTFDEFDFIFNSSGEEGDCMIFDLEMLKKFYHLI